MEILWFFVILTLVAAGAAGGVVFFQIRAIRRGRVPPPDPLLWNLFCQRRIDQAYVVFFSLLKSVARLSSFYSLVAVHRLLGVSRFLLLKLEKRFSRWIDMIRGRGAIHKKGSASLFLLALGDQGSRSRSDGSEGQTK